MKDLFDRSPSDSQPVIIDSTPPPSRVEPSPPARGFLQTISLAPGPAGGTIVCNLMLEPMYVASLGAAFVLGLFVASGLAYYCYHMQRHAGDPDSVAKGKAALVFVLTAAPLPLSPFIAAPAALAGLLARWTNRRGDE